MKYAPIVIPTLCRYEHFQRLIQSLLLNVGVDNTDLFIALDYPQNKSHWDGYNKIREYISTIQGFHSVTVLERKVNLGAAANTNLAVSEDLDKYDRIIFTEDDNVFSKNFLQYINKGLEKFQVNKNIFSISGYKHYYDLKFSENNYYYNGFNYSAWGVGIWKDRLETFNKEYNKQLLIKAFFCPSIHFRIFKSGWLRYHQFLTAVIDKRVPMTTDVGKNLYMIIKQLYCVVPSVSKVRNEGYDGTGLTCEKVSGKLHQEIMEMDIDESTDFTYEGDGFTYYKHNKKAFLEQEGNKMYRKLLFSFNPKSLLSKFKSVISLRSAKQKRVWE